MKKIDRRSFLKNPLKACSLNHSDDLSNKNEIIMFNRRNFLSTSITGFLAWVLSKRSEAQLIPFGFWKKGGQPPTYVDDVFATFLYTGNGATQTIINGIDLAGKGGMVWTKQRTNPGTQGHMLTDSARGLTYAIQSNSVSAEMTLASGITAFTSNGFSLGTDNTQNQTSATHTSWTFRKAAKFFDIVTWSGDGNANRQIAHSLGVAPGMILVKVRNAAESWQIYHISRGRFSRFDFTTAAEFDCTSAGTWAGTEPTSTSFYVGDTSATPSNNEVGETYVAYLYAHDPSANGFIQCGSYTGNGAATGPIVTLGWEPQFLLLKQAGGAGNWVMVDNARGLVASTGANNAGTAYCYGETVDSEFQSTTGVGVASLTATGFQVNGSTVINASGVSHIYMAIRRSNKPPTLGTQVYNAITRTGTSAAITVTGVGFPPDMTMISLRAGSTGEKGFIHDRLRGAGANKYIRTTHTAMEGDSSYGTFVASINQDGHTLGNDNNFGTREYYNNSGFTYVDHFFKRAKGFFDIVCYTGTGVARTVNHNLGVIPELMISKTRGSSNPWQVWTSKYSLMAGTALSDNCTGVLNVNNAFNGYSEAGSINTLPTAIEFSLGTQVVWNGSGNTSVMYLFATLAGVSKVGSYTGNGSGQTINCGFSTGARFVMIKRTDSAGDWYIWDTARGIVAGNDPHLSLNATDTEVTSDDSVDTDSSGFIVNQVPATNINVTSATYIFLAIA